MLSNILLSRVTPYVDEIVWGVISMDFNVTYQLLLVYSAFNSCWRGKKIFSLSLVSSSSSIICQTTGLKPLPKRFLHIVRSRASSSNWQYPLLSLRSCSSFLRLLLRLLVTSICPFIFPSITCCRRQFLLWYTREKIWLTF